MKQILLFEWLCMYLFVRFFMQAEQMLVKLLLCSNTVAWSADDRTVLALLSFVWFFDIHC